MRGRGHIVNADHCGHDSGGRELHRKELNPIRQGRSSVARCEVKLGAGHAGTRASRSNAFTILIFREQQLWTQIALELIG
jgi:hypothetical protein